MDIKVERLGHMTFFYWPPGPLLTDSKNLEKSIARYMYRGQIASASFNLISSGIFEIQFNPCAQTEKARKIVENNVINILQNSHI